MRVLVLATAVMVAGPALADAAADTAAIRERFARWTVAFNAGDAAGACNLFAPDLVYTVPEVIDGSREQLCGNLARVMAKPGVRLRYDPPAIHEIVVDGDTAVVRLTWTLTAEADGRTETTSEEGMDVFRRQPDGRWSIARFIAFTTRPNALVP